MPFTILERIGFVVLVDSDTHVLELVTRGTVRGLVGTGDTYNFPGTSTIRTHIL